MLNLYNQWRGNALRGPGSTLTWGASVARGPRFTEPPVSTPLDITHFASDTASIYQQFMGTTAPKRRGMSE